MLKSPGAAHGACRFGVVPARPSADWHDWQIGGAVVRKGGSGSKAARRMVQLAGRAVAQRHFVVEQLRLRRPRRLAEFVGP